MKRQLGLAALTLSVLLCGCNQADSEQSLVSETFTIPIETEDSAEPVTTAAATIQSAVTTAESAQTEQPPARQSSSIETTTAMTAAAHTTTAKTAAHPAETPDPQYFDYIFTDSAVCVRLTGSNYQVMHCDFSNVISDDSDSPAYELKDCNFDGKADLLVPTVIGQYQTSYAIFIWQPDTQHFTEKPIELRNPQFDEAKKRVTARVMHSETEQSYEIYQWQADYTLLLKKKYTADFQRLTLTQYTDEMTLQQQTSYSNTDELKAAFLALDE